jgi:hypothetical protein
MVAGPFPVRERKPVLAKAATPANWLAFRIPRNIGSEKEHPEGFVALKPSSLGQSPEEKYP